MLQRTQLRKGLASVESLARRVLGVGFRSETYTNLAYLLARFPLGVVYFTVVVTGLSLGIGLLPLIVGLPILAGVLALGGYVGVVEAALLNRLLGRNVRYEPIAPSDLSAMAYLKSVVTDPRNYALTAFALGSFVVGVHLLVAVTLVFSFGVTLLATPLMYRISGIEYGLPGTVDLGVLAVDVGSLAGPSINTLPEALVASVLGAAVCLCGLHAVNLTARLFAGVVQRLLHSELA